MRNLWLAALGFLTLTVSRGWAEPYLAAWKGVNCNACHVNQTGGFLRTDFGKNYGNSLQTFDWEGISEAAQKIQHSTPSWVAIGMDIHEGYNTTQSYHPEVIPNNSSFTPGGYQPLSRQDFSIQVKANEVISGVFTYRLDEGAVKEAYGLVSGLPEGGYIKFGNFLLPYGLTLSDDSSLVRGPLGFSFDTDDSGTVEVGIYPGSFFLNAALTNGQAGPTTLVSGKVVQNEKAFSAKAGFDFTDFTLGASLYAANLDEPSGTDPLDSPPGTNQVLSNFFGWGRVGPVVILAEYDHGTNEVAGFGGVGLGPDDLAAYHVSAEVDLGSDVYLRLVRERFSDSLNQEPFIDGLRHVVSLRFYPMRNLKTQIDFQRTDPLVAVNQPSYSLLADAFVFY